MKLKRGDLIEVAVTDIVFGGRGLTRIDGMAVFVDQAVPGDRGLARVYRRKKNFAEARLVALTTPSADRVEAPCRYSGHCGGCKWQFLAYERQLAYKRRHVAEALAHIGGLGEVPVQDTIPSERTFGYRNKMEFTCAERRWLMPEELDDPGADRGFALGLHVPGTFDKVLDIDRCLLMPAEGNEILAAVRECIRASGRPVYGLRSHQGFWRFVVLRHSAARDRWLVNLVTASADGPYLAGLARELMGRFGKIAGVVNNVTARKAGVAVGEVEYPLAGEAQLVDCIGPFEFEISANSFFQTNTAGAETLYRTVGRYARLSGRQTVLDLYSGIGTIPIFLSAGAAEIVGIEIVDSAVADAERNCRRNGVENCRFIAGDIIDGLAQVGRVPEVMIIDPPRAGMHKDVVRRVLEMAPPRIVYVSCNPATLARDLALMQEVYRVVEVQPVDLFPHTFHIESVTELVRR